MNRRISEILYFSIYYFGKHSWKHWLPVKFRLADCLYWIWFYWTNIYQWHFHAHTNLHREVFYTYQRLETGDSHRSMKTPQDRFKFLQLIIRILNSMIQLDDDSLFYKNIYCISSNKCRVSNKRCPLIKAPPLAIHTEISTSPLIRPAPMNAALLRTVAIFY